MQKINIDYPVSKMDFGTYCDTIGIHDTMRRNGVKNIDILCRCSEAMIASMGHFTAPQMLAIKTSLATYGLKFNMTAEELQAYKDLPDDAFKNKDITEEEVEKIRSDYYAILVEKDKVAKELAKCRLELENMEPDFLLRQRLKSLDMRMTSAVETLTQLTVRLEMSAYRSENHQCEAPEEEQPSAEPQPEYHTERPDYHRPYIPDVGFYRPTHESEEPADEEEPAKEEKEDDEEVECELDDMIDLLSGEVLRDLLEGHTSTVNNYLYKKKLMHRWDSSCENLFCLCRMNEQKVLSFFDDNSVLVSDLKSELKRHGLKLGMGTLELDVYQAMYEHIPKPVDEVQEIETPIDKRIREVEEYLDIDPVLTVRSDDFVWLRFRLIEKSLLCQPWWVKMFCSTEQLFKRAYKMADTMYQMEIENMREKSIDHFERHMNDVVNK